MAVQETPQAKIGVKEAVSAATIAIRELLAGEELVDLRLEEVEQSEDERYWLITLGFTEEGSRAAFTFPRPSDYVRRYKVFKIDANTGKVVAMKIRDV